MSVNNDRHKTFSNWDWYDPPDGSRYGFPKKYRPLDGEEVKDTLIRDGYPAHLLEGKNAYRLEGIRFGGRRNCPHNEGWWKLTKDYMGYKQGKRWCCLGGCGYSLTNAEYKALNGKT